MHGESGKGDKRRPMQVPREEYELRWNLAFGLITREEFDREMEKLKNERN